jgi:hypothetical protein
MINMNFTVSDKIGTVVTLPSSFILKLLIKWDNYQKGMNTTKKAVERPGPTMADTDIMGDLVSEIHPVLHRLRDWAYPDQIDMPSTART